MTATIPGGVNPDEEKAEKHDSASPPPSLHDLPSAPSPTDTITWDSSPSHPRNWPNSRRWKNALIISITGFLSTSGSSIFVPATSEIEAQFGGVREVVILATALYVLGLGFGPFVFAPISELYGRQVSYTVSMIGE